MAQPPITPAEVVRRLLRQRVGLLSYIRSILVDEHLAEDVFQEVCVVAMQKHDELNSWEHFDAWVRKVARYEALSALRRSRKLSQLLDEALLDLLDDHWQRYKQEQVQGDRTRALKECIGGLTPYAQRLVRLRYEQGLSGQALADALKRKVQAVYVALTRAHKALAECVRRRLHSPEAAHE